MGSNTAATVHTLYLNRENITYSLLGFEKLWLQDFLYIVTFVTKIPKKNLKPINPVDMKYIKKPRIRVSNFNMIIEAPSISSLS